MRAASRTLLMGWILAAPLFVQNAAGQFQLTLGGGANQPIGAYADEAKTGFGLTAGLGYEAFSYFVVGLETSFYANQASDETLESLGDGYDLSTRVQQITGFLRVQLPVGEHHLFAKGVVGSYLGSAKLTAPSGSVSVRNTDPGYGLGGGFLINGARGTSFFADATYHSVTYDGADEATSFMSYSIGALFRFGFSG